MTGKQRFAEWVRDQAIVVDAIDPHAPLDDLEPLRAVIGDARMVAIGESAHYVREFYLLRHRLMRFLAERRGFTVYALEAPSPRPTSSTPGSRAAPARWQRSPPPA